MKRHGSVWPFAVASILLMLAPSSCSQRARVTVLLGFAPARNLAEAANGLAQRSWDRFRPGKHDDEFQRQNEFYRSRIVTLHAEKGELLAKLESATAARGVVADPDFELLPADIILNLDASPFRQSMTIACGSRHGAGPGMLVLHHNHVIGKILESGPWTSRVMLVGDPGFRIGAVAVPPTGDSAVSQRKVGVFEGTGGTNAILKWLDAQTPVEEGAYVMTSEYPDKGVPKGLILGRVTGVERGRGASPRVEVTPVVNPQGLEFVLVLRPR